MTLATQDVRLRGERCAEQHLLSPGARLLAHSVEIQQFEKSEEAVDPCPLMTLFTLKLGRCGERLAELHLLSPGPRLLAHDTEIEQSHKSEEAVEAVRV